MVLLGLLALLTWGAIALVRVGSQWAGEAFSAEPAVEEGPVEEDEVDAVAEPGPCAVEDLAVDVEVASAEDGETGFAVAVVNEAEEPCLVDAGSSSLVLTVHSGDDRVWSSADCPAGRAERMLLLDAGGETEATITWDGQRSAPGCEGEESEAAAGTYRVIPGLGGVELDDETVFER